MKQLIVKLKDCPDRAAVKTECEALLRDLQNYFNSRADREVVRAAPLLPAAGQMQVEVDDVYLDAASVRSYLNGHVKVEHAYDVTDARMEPAQRGGRLSAR